MSNLGQECEAEYAWTLTETESEKVVAKGEFTAGEVDNSKNMVLKLSELEESKGKPYVLMLTSYSAPISHKSDSLNRPMKNDKQKLRFLLCGSKPQSFYSTISPSTYIVNFSGL